MDNVVVRLPFKPRLVPATAEDFSGVEMSEKWTPGPWRIDDKGPLLGGYFVKAAEDDHTFIRIAEVDDVTDANLIAAAPDLYEALDALTRDLADYPAWQRPCHAVDRARAALEKARGVRRGTILQEEITKARGENEKAEGEKS